MSGDGGRSLREVLGIRYLSTSPADISVFGRDSTRSRFALLDPTRALAAMSTPVSTGAGDRQRRHRATPLNPGSFGPRGLACGRAPNWHGQLRAFFHRLSPAPEREESCRRSKWTSAIFADRAGEAGVHRPGLDRLLKHAKLKLIELVIVWKLDTFGRLLGRVILCAPAGLDSDGHSR